MEEFDLIFKRRHIYKQWTPVANERVVSVVTLQLGRQVRQGAKYFSDLMPAWRVKYACPRFRLTCVQSAGDVEYGCHSQWKQAVDRRIWITTHGPRQGTVCALPPPLPLPPLVRFGGIIVEVDVVPDTRLARALRVYVVAKRGGPEATVMAMRKRCDAVGDRVRKSIRRETAQAEREKERAAKKAEAARKKRAKEAGEEEDAPPALADSDSEDESGDAAIAVERARKRRRLGHGDGQEELIFTVDGAGIAEDLERAEDETIQWQQYALEVSNLEGKYARTAFERLRASPAERNRAFGKAPIPNIWPVEYTFLRGMEAGYIREHLMEKYYLGCEGKLRGAVPADHDLPLQTDAEILAANVSAWTMAAAWTCAGVQENTTGVFCTPIEYYPEMAGLGLGQADEKCIEGGSRQFFSSGAIAPTAFPQDARYTFRVVPAFLVPETLFSLPLPFQLGDEKVDDQMPYYDAKITLDALVVSDPRKFAEYKRASQGEYTLDEQRDNIRSLFQDGHEDPAALASAYVAPNVEKQLREAMGNVPGLQRWAQARSDYIREQLNGYAAQFKTGKYPGLLSMTTHDFTARQLAETFQHAWRDPTISEQELAERLLAYATEIERQQGGPVVSDTKASMQTEDSKKLTADLLTKLRQVKSDCGRLGTLDQRLFDKSDELTMKAINFAEAVQFERRVKDMTEEQRMRELRHVGPRRARETYENIERSRNDSDAMLRMEATLRGLLATGTDKLPAYGLMGDDPFVGMVEWMETMLQQPFQIALKNWQTAIICWFAAKTALICPDFFNGEPLLNISLEGKAQSGKSRQLQVVQATHLEGACLNANHITPQAFTSNGNNSNAIILQNEAPHEQFVDPYDKSSGKKTSDAGADPKKYETVSPTSHPARANIMKSMLTEFMASSITLKTDPITGERTRETFLSRASNVYMHCANWDIGESPSPILSRYVRIELQKPSTREASDDVQAQHRPRAVEDAAALTRITNHHHIWHGLILKVERMISAGGIANVVQDQAAYGQVLVERHLKDKLGVPQANFSARKSQAALLLARVICVANACWMALMTHDGQAWRDHHKQATAFSWYTIYYYISPKLAVTRQHYAYALSLLGFQLVSQVDTDAMIGLAIMARAQDRTSREGMPIDDRDFPGDRQTAQHLGLIQARMAPQQAGIGPGGPTDIAVHMAPTGSSWVLDHGYVTSKGKDEASALESLSRLLYDLIKMAATGEQLSGILRGKRDLIIEAHYYKAQPNGELAIARFNDGRAPTRRVPAVITGYEQRIAGTRQRYFIAINLDYLALHHAIPIAIHAAEEIVERATELTAEEKARYTTLVNTPLGKRLDIEEIKYDEAVKPGTIARFCECDILRHPIAHAIRLAYENPVLGLCTEVYVPGKLSGHNFAREEQLNLLDQPPDVRVLVPITGEADRAVFLPLGFTQQRLTLRRKGGQGDVPMFRNGNRQKMTGRTTLGTALAGVAHAQNVYLLWASTIGVDQEIDFDALAVLQRHEDMGCWMDEYYKKVYSEASSSLNKELQLSSDAPTLSHLPATYPPLARRLAVYASLKFLDTADTAHAETVRTIRAARRYPYVNVEMEIKELKTLVLHANGQRDAGIAALHSRVLRQMPAWLRGPDAPATASVVVDAMDLDAPPGADF